MTISKGAEWGRVVARPADLTLVPDDAALCAALIDAGGPVAPTSGDLHRTVGGRNIDGLDEVLELPIDLLDVAIDSGTHRACAHVQLRRPRWRGGWWAGPVLMVMNAEFIGNWQIAARGHPNDGRAESCGWGADFGIRQRFEARRRLPTAAHVPHPAITTGSFRERSWTFDEPLDVLIDSTRVGTTRSLQVSVVADAAVIYA